MVFLVFVVLCLVGLFEAGMLLGCGAICSCAACVMITVFVVVVVVWCWCGGWVVYSGREHLLVCSQNFFVLCSIFLFCLKHCFCVL